MKKSPAENKPGQSVEDIFRDGFSEAESTPPPRIWENVHLGLENHELHRFRKQATWYRAMAAAFLLLLVSAGIILWQQDPTQPGQQETRIAATPEKTNETAAGRGMASEEAVTEKEQSGAGTTQKIASVSEPISQNQLQNGSESIVPSSRKVRSQGSPQVEKASVEVLAQQSPTVEKEIAAASLPETPVTEMNEVARAENEPAGKREVKGQFVMPLNVGEKTFRGATFNSLAATPRLPSLLDSLASAPQKSILAQKVSEKAALQETELALVQAQSVGTSNEREMTGLSRWSVTMAYSPEYVYAPVKIGSSPSMLSAAPSNQTQGNQQQYKAAIDEYNSSYTPAYSYTTMVGASYKLNEKWQLESGVLYTQNEATTTQTYLFYGSGSGYLGASAPGTNFTGSNRSTPLVHAFASDASGRPVHVTRTDEYSTRYKYQQIGLPLRLAYRLNMKKVYALFSGGVNMNFLVQNSILPESNQVEAVRFGFKEKDSPFRTLQWATTTSVGLGYDVTPKVSILLAPQFTYALTSMLRDEQYQANTYQLGVSIGGRWRLTK